MSRCEDCARRSEGRAVFSLLLRFAVAIALVVAGIWVRRVGPDEWLLGSILSWTGAVMVLAILVYGDRTPKRHREAQ